MPWTIHLNARSEKFLNRLDPKQQRLVAKAIDQMRDDPLEGDVKPLRDKKWSGFFRKRVGRYRLIFRPIHDDNYVEIREIVPRNEKTYR